MSRRHAFTLIELLVVVAIIGLLISILLPSLSSARASARSVLCLSNLRSMGQSTQIYLQLNRERFPVRDNSAPGGGGNFNAFLPSRMILKADKRPVDIFACPDDRWDGRKYQVGDGTVTYPDSLGIGAFYGLEPEEKVRYSYGINNMTGVNPTTPEEKLLFNNALNAYRRPAETLLYADCSFFNARGHNKKVNDEMRLKARIANSAVESLINVLTDVPAEWGEPRPEYLRHAHGSNILYMDNHAETETQEYVFESLIFSWTEPVLGEPIP